MNKFPRLIHFVISTLSIILLFITFFVTAKPAHALTIYFKDDFSNGVNGQTPVQVDPTDYTSSNGYFYVLPDLVYDNTNGLWLNGNTGAGDVLKGTSVNQTYYCAGYTFLRDVNDNHTYESITMNSTGRNGYVFNMDMNWDTATINELSIFLPTLNSYLFNIRTLTFDTSQPQHWVQACNNAGVLGIYLDGNLLASANDSTFVGGDVDFSFFYAPHSHIKNWAVTDGPTSNYPVEVPPVVNAISVSINPVQVNTATSASANFTDADTSDTHTATWNWGDGNTTSGTVTESNGSGSVSNTHIYTTAGVYTVTLTVTDQAGGVGTNIYQYVAVYDPSAGFLTGSGKYNSLAGWDTQNPQATGEVKFGIEAKYHNGTTPMGKSDINFKVGNLDFASTSYSWLVVSGAKATLQGTGTINGAGNYTILISAIDGSQTGGKNLIRIKITDSSNTVIYDTQPGAANTADPTTALTNGSIKVH